MTSRWIGIHTGGPHALDHIGVLSIMLGLKLLVTEEETYRVARKFYPSLTVEFIPLASLSLEFLATHFDVIFESANPWALELTPMFQLLFNKTVRIVYCPHGNSDKKHPSPKDITLYYGPQMLQHLSKTGSGANSYIRSGNYRYDYYLQNSAFYDALFEKELQGKLIEEKKTVFFAPTWPDGQSESSFPLCRRVIEEVGALYNLLIRWHPFINDLFPAETEQLRSSYEDRKGVVFLADFPAIYPILNKSDIYLGDSSSIGYDFLTFNRPLFFLSDQEGDIRQAGNVLDIKEDLGKQIFEYKESKPQREALYKFVFGERRESDEILVEIEKALQKESLFKR